MSVAGIVVPLVGAVMDLVRRRKDDVARDAGVPRTVVDKVSDVLQDYLGQDEKAFQAVMAEIDKARVHDATTATKAPPIVDLLRGLVRPLITFGAFGWYVVARLMDIPLLAEDYALIGGVVAFWFGFRSFDKQR